MNAPVPTAPVILEPVGEQARVSTVDVLRGFALCGIFLMNLVSFALPTAAYMNPVVPSVEPYAGSFTGLNRAVWVVQYLLGEAKMMSIFSMLFGAGLVLMDGRAAGRQGDAKRGRFAGVYYRRMLTLLCIGMAHAYLIWYGDVLVCYAVCGLVLYPLRGLRVGTLITLGVLLIMLSALIGSIMGGSMWAMNWMVESALSGLPPGATPPEHVREMQQGLADFRRDFIPSPEAVSESIRAHTGSPREMLAWNAKETRGFQLFVLPLFMMWQVGGLMLLGMALMKARVFSAERSEAFYFRLAAWGYGLGLPLVATGIFLSIRGNFEPIAEIFYVWRFNGFGSIGVALGHVAVVMLLCKRGALVWLRDRLAAAGRMALTNYLCQSLIGVFIFWGWGLALFGKIERGWLPLFALGVWTLELTWSPWWLARFHYGPVEWLWRTCTHLKAQPMRRR